MEPMEAWLYAASWGSYMHSGDSGACMYGFTEECKPQSREHRANVIRYISQECLPLVLANPENYDPEELENMRAFLRYIRNAPLLGSN